MAKREIPYPPSPEDVPEGLTLPSPAYVMQMIMLMGSLIIFVILYIGLVLGSLWLCYFGVTGINEGWFLQVLAVGFGLLSFFYLVRGFFASNDQDKDIIVELKEADQPVLFAFIRKLCQETKSPIPSKVVVTPNVNAAMVNPTRFINLIVPSKPYLLVGLGLVNALNLSEFKAVLAHEFGHFAQKKAMGINAYTRLSLQIIEDLIYRRDWLDRLLHNPESPLGQAVAGVCKAYLWLMRNLMYGLYRCVTFIGLGMSRQQEFNADLVAVSVAGSDAIVHALFKLNFATAALNQAYTELQLAVDHKLYSADLYAHMTKAGEFIRRTLKDPTLGEPPALKRRQSSKRLRVFRTGDDGGIPEMWSTHPANYLREENAKGYYIPGPVDDRSAWIVFTEPDTLKARMSKRFYRHAFKIPKDAELQDPDVIQQFIDEERREQTYDARYHKAYDDRRIDPGDLAELVQLVSKEPWEDERLARVYSKLYAELEDRMQDRNARVRDYDWLDSYQRDEKAPAMVRFKNKDVTKKDTKKLLKKLDEQLKEDYEWLSSFDRRVFLVHANLAHKYDSDAWDEMIQRYRFQIGIQRINLELDSQLHLVEAGYQELFEKPRQEPITQDYFESMASLFKAARKTLKTMLKDCQEIEVPVLANFAPGTPLASFLLTTPIIKEMKELSIDGKWIAKLHGQLREVRGRAGRLHFKNLGTILALQERLIKEFMERMSTEMPLVAEAVRVKDEEDDIPEAILDEDDDIPEAILEE